MSPTAKTAPYNLVREYVLPANQHLPAQAETVFAACSAKWSFAPGRATAEIAVVPPTPEDYYCLHPLVFAEFLGYVLEHSLQNLTRPESLHFLCEEWLEKRVRQVQTGGCTRAQARFLIGIGETFDSLETLSKKDASEELDDMTDSKDRGGDPRRFLLASSGPMSASAKGCLLVVGLILLVPLFYVAGFVFDLFGLFWSFLRIFF